MQPVAPSKQAIREAVTRALQEDVGSGDVTAALIPEGARATATVISREAATLCGTAWFDGVFEQLDPAIQVQWQTTDAKRLAENQVLCTLQGPARPILTGERTALNFLQTLSGTATAAARYAEAVRGTAARVLDTRKTLPGLREAQKYAVLCGGCSNHRQGLYDGILIKENHIMAAGGIQQAVTAARRQSSLAVEVEVENLTQVDEALEAGADILLLDNFSLSHLVAAVQANAGRAKLEASGGITLQNIAAVAATGVDYISIGAMTKDVKAVDLSMRFQIR